ncbi:hypothetical protein EVAR_63600_1 [Eumeta japonica]|uniref:Uncharacterized protein n=1 Tax=Eumeta variegata TaxID=151549 RepID=A0A4C1ZN44_EUMVA|nr:hypothetical protein EVAR_63600_1 [Eumeta japonica]
MRAVTLGYVTLVRVKSARIDYVTGRDIANASLLISHGEHYVREYDVAVEFSIVINKPASQHVVSNSTRSMVKAYRYRSPIAVGERTKVGFRRES